MWVTVPGQAATLAELLPGTYSNEEQAYFDTESGKANVAPSHGMRLSVEGDDVTVQPIDMFGAPAGMALHERIRGSVIYYPDCPATFTPDGDGYRAIQADTAGCKSGADRTASNKLKSVRIDPNGITYGFTDGREEVLRRARTATCWGTVPKIQRMADGSEDWYFAAGLKLHDQGGRAQFGGGATGAPPVIIRMRNVVWPSGPNKPSLVLYVHKPENPDHAESYSWADPDAKRIGINLRWMQASCSIDGK
jgi:hypothetical protein